MSQAAQPEQAVARERPLVVRIVHASPGRIRAKVPREAFDSPLLRQAEDALLALDGVQSVRRNVAASSVLVTYDPAVATVPTLFTALADTNVTLVAPDDEVGRSPGTRRLALHRGALAGGAVPAVGPQARRGRAITTSTCERSFPSGWRRSPPARCCRGGRTWPPGTRSPGGPSTRTSSSSAPKSSPASRKSSPWRSPLRRPLRCSTRSPAECACGCLCCASSRPSRRACSRSCALSRAYGRCA